jgi:PAS domain S-box-containing protein
MDAPKDTQGFVVGESFARILTETTQSLVCVLDRDGRILLFNEACERATGYRREEVLGRDARDFVIPPEEREAFGEFLSYVWRTRSASPQVGHWQNKQGQLRLIAWSNHPMAGPDGEPESLVTTGIDLTDRAPPSPEAEGALAADPDAKLAEVGRLATEQRALRRVATLVASEVRPERVFTAVSEGCARVLEVNAAVVVRYEGDGSAAIVGRHNRDGIDVFRVGDTLPPDEQSAVARVRATAAGARARWRTRCSGRATAPPPRRRSWWPAPCGARWRSRASGRSRPTASTVSVGSASWPRWPSRARRRAPT